MTRDEEGRTGSLVPVGYSNVSPNSFFTSETRQNPRYGERENDRVLRDVGFFTEANGRLPTDAGELSRFLRRKITSRQLDDALAVIGNVATAKNKEAYQKEKASVEKERRKEALATFKSVRKELMSTENPNLYGEDGLKYFKELPEAEQAKIIRDEAKKRMRQKEEAGLLPSVPSEPAPAGKVKERPSGGGRMVVGSEDMPGAKAGTVITTQGPWQDALQWKFEPTGDGNYIAYKRHTGKLKKGELPSMSPAWEAYEKPVTREFITRNLGANVLKDEREAVETPPETPTQDNLMGEMPPEEYPSYEPTYEPTEEYPPYEPNGLLPPTATAKTNRTLTPEGYFPESFRRTGETAFDEGLSAARFLRPHLMPTEEEAQAKEEQYLENLRNQEYLLPKIWEWLKTGGLSPYKS